jgi:hypothetical protein
MCLQVRKECSKCQSAAGYQASKKLSVHAAGTAWQAAAACACRQEKSACVTHCSESKAGYETVGNQVVHAAGIASASCSSMCLQASRGQQCSPQAARVSQLGYYILRIQVLNTAGTAAASRNWKAAMTSAATTGTRQHIACHHINHNSHTQQCHNHVFKPLKRQI